MVQFHYMETTFCQLKKEKPLTSNTSELGLTFYKNTNDKAEKEEKMFLICVKSIPTGSKSLLYIYKSFPANAGAAAFE